MYQDYIMPYYAESPPTLQSLFSEVLVTQFPLQYSRDTVPSDSVLYCTSRAKAFDCDPPFNGLDPYLRIRFCKINPSLIIK